VKAFSAETLKLRNENKQAKISILYSCQMQETDWIYKRMGKSDNKSSKCLGNDCQQTGSDAGGASFDELSEYGEKPSLSIC